MDFLKAAGIATAVIFLTALAMHVGRTTTPELELQRSFDGDAVSRDAELEWSKQHPDDVVEYGSHDQHERSSKWPAVRNSHLKQHPTCEYPGCMCGPLEVHHIIPFHKRRDLELDPNNLITLCRDPIVNHHLYGGHDGSFTRDNPNIREDARKGQYPKRGGELQRAHELWIKTHPDR